VGAPTPTCDTLRHGRRASSALLNPQAGFVARDAQRLEQDEIHDHMAASPPGKAATGRWSEPLRDAQQRPGGCVLQPRQRFCPLEPCGAVLGSAAVTAWPCAGARPVAAATLGAWRRWVASARWRRGVVGFGEGLSAAAGGHSRWLGCCGDLLGACAGASCLGEGCASPGPLLCLPVSQLRCWAASVPAIEPCPWGGFLLQPGWC